MTRQNNFDAIAIYYDWLARLVFGRAIQESQSCYFDLIPSSSRILVLGGGSGHTLPLLEPRKPRLITFVEPSAAMLDLARAKVQKPLPVQFVQGNINDLATDDAPYDVVITAYVLDIFEPLELSQVMSKLSALMSKRGIWLFTDFHIASNAARRWQLPALQLMYLFFRITCQLKAKQLPKFEPYFLANGLTIAKSKSFWSGFMISRVYQFEG